MPTTGDRIKAARLAAKLTQTELAEKIGVKFSAIHKYEAGLVVNLKRETIDALAKALNVKPSYLLCLDDEPDITEEEQRKANEEAFIKYISTLSAQEKIELTKKIMNSI